MLPKRHRLDRELFDSVNQNGRSFHSPFFSARIDRITAEERRFSFVISKKVVKTSVERHLLRRRGYAAVREVFPGIRPGFAVIFFLKKEAVSADYQAFRQAIEDTLKNARLMHG
jgi:ribonuclease P protein component